METKTRKPLGSHPSNRAVVSFPDEKSSTVGVVAPSVLLDEDVKQSLLSQVEVEGVVTVHCAYHSADGEVIRIWRSTYLVEKSTGIRSKLVDALDIPFYPVRLVVPAGTTALFTLFFAPLARSCEAFDLFEDIPELGGFEIKDIQRNQTDVYHVCLDNSGKEQNYVWLG
ncbi:MAG: hypothetical protein WCL00_06785 [Bacteroidota bacterium]